MATNERLHYPTRDEINEADGVLLFYRDLGTTPSEARGIKWNSEGFERLWIFSESFGPLAIIRARSCEEAYESALRYMSLATPIEEWDAEEQALFDTKGETPEGVHWCDDIGDYVQEDLNGSALEPLEEWCARHDVDCFAHRTFENVASESIHYRHWYADDDPENPEAETAYALLCDDETGTD